MVAVVRNVAALRDQVAGWRSAGDVVALVPTMGALHEGHLAHVEAAGARANRVVVSIFVNPTQFAPHEDFDAYPRDLQRDAGMLTRVGADLVYAPDRDAMYPEGFATKITPGGVASGLEGSFRPHFFSGVATVVCKLLMQAMPDYVTFGEKDYQQLQVVRQMVRDLDVPVVVVPIPTLRESDGLAMSSRNAYLNDSERATAPLLHRAICDVASDVAEGRDIEDAIEVGMKRLIAVGFEVDYLAVCDPVKLVPLHGVATAPVRVLVAAKLGRTRLIDNVGSPSPASD